MGVCRSFRTFDWPVCQIFLTQSHLHFSFTIQSIELEQGVLVRWKAWIAAVVSIGLLVSCQRQGGVDWPTADEVSSIADWVGIAGFAIGIKVWFTTRALNQRFLKIARIPELLRDLTALDKKLLTAVQANSLEDVGAIASQLNSSLESVSGKVGLWQKVDVWRLRRKLTSIRSGAPIDRAYARHIWDELQGVIKTLEHIKNENKWVS